MAFKDIKMKDITVAAAIFLLAVIILGFFGINFKEKFTSFKDEDYRPVYLKKSFLTKRNNDFMSSGAIYKHRLNGKYQYLYQFNLPNAIGGDYNKMHGRYIAYAGPTSNNLSKQGQLVRSSDGWYRMKVIDNKNHKYAKIVFVAPEAKETVLEGEI